MQIYSDELEQLQRLIFENEKLRELLNRHLINIPDFFAPEQNEDVYSLDPKDDLPF